MDRPNPTEPLTAASAFDQPRADFSQRAHSCTGDPVCLGCSIGVPDGNPGLATLPSTPGSPVNLGLSCPAGGASIPSAEVTDRVTTPLLRRVPHGRWETISWVRAIHEFVSRMKSIQARYGPDSLAVLSPGQIGTEETALLGSLFKFGMGGRHGDSATGPCREAAAHSLSRPCSATGSHPFANTSSLLGGRDFARPDHRETVARILGIPVQRIPEQSSWAQDRILEGIDTGTIRALWIIATDTSPSWVRRERLSPWAEKLDFLVVQDRCVASDLARRAHLILPSAGWGEKEGTLISSPRRIAVVKKLRSAPGDSLSDFDIFKLIASGWGCSDLFRKWLSPETVFQILKRLSAGQSCDLTGIRDYRHLDESGGLQWPYSAADAEADDQRAYKSRTPSSTLPAAAICGTQYFGFPP
jgi:predicted molibdopterin-dependent oxidoreductase YjgC